MSNLEMTLVFQVFYILDNVIPRYSL